MIDAGRGHCAGIQMHNIATGTRNIFMKITRAYLKNRILVQSQGGAEFQTAGILKYVEDLKRDPNMEIGPKDIFEMRSINIRF